MKLYTNGQSKNGNSHENKHAGLFLGEGTKIHDTAKTDAILMTGKNCEIGANANLSGHVILGDNCVVEEGVSLTNCLVWANSKIGKGSQLTSTVVAGNTTVQPNVRHDKAALVPGQTIVKPLASNGVK